MIQPQICIRQLWRASFANLPKRSLPSRLTLRYASTTQEPLAASSPGPSAEFSPIFEPPPMRDASMTGEAGIRRYKPRTPGLRHLVRPVNDHIYKGRPLFKLTFPKRGRGRGGRNHTGRITVRHRGGGHKRRIRIVDFDRIAGGEHLVERIEHDPNRSAHIALVTNKQTGAQSYILAAEGLRAGDIVQSYRSGIPKALLDSMGGIIDPGILAARTAWRGNCLPLGMIPVGTPIFNISLLKDGKAVYCRSAGTHAFILGKGEDVVRKELVKRMEDARAREDRMVVERAQKAQAEKLASIQGTKEGAAKVSEKGKKSTTEPVTSEIEGKEETTPASLTADSPTVESLQPAQPAEVNEEESDELDVSDGDLKKLERATQFVTVKLSSGEVRLMPRDAVATIGVASNGNHQFAQLGKAGRKRWLGIRPTVRGLAMNAVDHPHGGGRGKSKSKKHPVSPWGKPAKSGYKTRDRKKVDKLIVQPRPRNHGKRRTNKK